MKKRPTDKSQSSANNRPHYNPQQDGQQHDMFGFEGPLPPAGFDPANPRHKRVGVALLERGLLRADVDVIAGAANGPQLMADIGERNVHWTCKRLSVLDRDKRRCRPGFYELTPAGRELVCKRLRGNGEADKCA